MKEALVLLGRIPHAYVRPPLTAVSEGERLAIQQALGAAGLLDRHPVSRSGATPGRHGGVR